MYSRGNLECGLRFRDTAFRHHRNAGTYLQVAGSHSGPVSASDEKRPRVIAAAAGPLPDGRRKRLFIVEPLGMWVKNGQAVPGPRLSVPSSRAAAQDAIAETVPEDAPAPGPPDEGPAVAADLESCGKRNSAGGGHSPAAAGNSPSLLAALPVCELQPLKQFQQQHCNPYNQPPPQQHPHQPRSPDVMPYCNLMAFSGPVRRLAPCLSLAQHQQAAPLSSARFQPYAHRPSSADSPAVAAASRLLQGAVGGLPLLATLGVLSGDALPGSSGSGGPPDGVFTVLQRQGSGWVRESGLGLCPQQQQPLLPVPRQESLPTAAAASNHSTPTASGAGAGGTTAAPPGAAAASLFHTWLRGEEVPLEEETTGDGSDGGDGTPPLTSGAMVSARLPGQGLASGTSAAPMSVRAAAAASLTPAGLQLQLLLQQQHLFHPAAPQRPPLATGIWSNGCAEVWAAAFGESAPEVLPPPAAAACGTGGAVDLGFAAGISGRWPGPGGVAAQVRASPTDPAPRS